ncbi:MAG: tetratricopeptide repeat protein [Steroidobacteraceae bacterium]|nr:tetratricopeptide repeat protein [Steroidobacteraceae bacterium]MCW5573393.1 tetratricopeptide repeat protein [Steroidobacteraceae bacterium]
MKTQAALAERIAELEGLDAAPKDIVNRAFREQPVEMQTLERIARALGVEAHQLYKTAGDGDLAGTSPEGDSPPAPSPAAAPVDREPSPISRRPSFAWPIIASAAIFVLAFGYGGWRYAATQRPAAGGLQAPALQSLRDLLAPDLGTPALLIMQIEGDEGALLAEALRKELSHSFNVASPTSTVLTQSLPPRDAARRLRTDVTVNGEILQVGRLSAVRLYALAAGNRQQFWAESVPTVALPHEVGHIARRAAATLRHAADRLGTRRGATPVFPSAPAQDDYLDGQLYLERPSNELNVKRAQSRFAAALRQSPDYARAHAGLCESLLEEHWMSDEQRSLQDAAQACGRAHQLAPDDPVVKAARAHFLRRTGRNDEAIASYRQVIAKHPHDSWALNGLAASLLQAYQQHGRPELLDQATEAARTAAEIDPHVWKPLFSLASIRWFAGDVRGAIAASEAALRRDQNEYVLANLGSFYLCGGQYEQALETYLLARQASPQSYVGDEFLGMAYYYLGEFVKSVQLRRRAIDTIASGEPEIHQMWGNLADSYRQAGDADAAADAYVHAAEIVERDILRGTASRADQASRVYYYTILRELAPDKVPDTVDRQIAAELDDIAQSLDEPTAHLRMAQTWWHRGASDEARAALSRATATCPGYAGHPDLAQLLEHPR